MDVAAVRLVGDAVVDGQYWKGAGVASVVEEDPAGRDEDDAAR